MNTQAVLGYQNLLSARIGQLVSQLEKREGEEVDLSSWLSCLSYVVSLVSLSSLTRFVFRFDFMGDLAYVL